MQIGSPRGRGDADHLRARHFRLGARGLHAGLDFDVPLLSEAAALEPSRRAPGRGSRQRRPRSRRRARGRAGAGRARPRPRPRRAPRRRARAGRSGPRGGARCGPGGGRAGGPRRAAGADRDRRSRPGVRRWTPPEHAADELAIVQASLVGIVRVLVAPRQPRCGSASSPTGSRRSVPDPGLSVAALRDARRRRLIGFVRDLPPQGGGDDPEAIDAALARRSHWNGAAMRRGRVVVIGDNRRSMPHRDRPSHRSRERVPAFGGG